MKIEQNNNPHTLLREQINWHDGCQIVKIQLCEAVPGKFFGIVRQGPSDSESNRLHVDIFRFCSQSFEVYSIDSSKMIGIFPEVSNFNRLNLKLNRFIWCAVLLSVWTYKNPGLYIKYLPRARHGDASRNTTLILVTRLFRNGNDFCIYFSKVHQVLFKLVYSLFLVA